MAWLTSSPQTDAADALARGAPLVALGLVARDASALGLAMRGVAYAQMGDYDVARDCLERATAALDATPLVRARARAALIELSLHTGDPAPAARDARDVADTLAALGDARNEAMQRLVVARAEVLMGRLDEARRIVTAVLEGDLAPDVRAVAWLARAEVAIRAIAPTDAKKALAAARDALTHAPNDALLRALDALDAELAHPVARLCRHGAVVAASLFDIEATTQGPWLFVDACRGTLSAGRVSVPLGKRPVLLALLMALARAYPASVPRDALASAAFDTRVVNASHRARLRVEIGRLRKLMDGLAASPKATTDGFALVSSRDVAVLLAATDDGAARIAMLLADGASWSAQSLSEHAGVSLRTAQRALVALVARGGAVRSGPARESRYARPGTPVASRMLLLGLVPTP